MTAPFLRALALAGVLALAALPAPAEAHRLKLFLTVEDAEITGYAFFVGGGRPEGVDFVVRDTNGAEIHRGRTAPDGGLRWRPDRAADYTVTVDAGDGHWVSATLGADRLGSVAPAPIAGDTPAAPSEPSPSAVAPTAGPAAIDPATLARLIEARVDAALARQLRPLIEAQEKAEGRVRFNEVVGGLGMIAGLAGTALWASARRRRDEGGRRP